MTWSAQVLSPSSKRLMKLELPDVPLAPIKVVDLNGDGLNDLLVVVQVRARRELLAYAHRVAFRNVCGTCAKNGKRSTTATTPNHADNGTPGRDS